MSSAAVKDNKTANENDVAHNEVKKLLNVKSQQSVETCPHRKTPVSQDIGTLHYDCKSNRLMFIKIHENLMQKKRLILWGIYIKNHGKFLIEHRNIQVCSLALAHPIDCQG